MTAKTDYRKITTLINRALLICDEKEDTAVLRYLLENARSEAQNLSGQIKMEPISPKLH
ncbi:hypothetical protein [Cohaesibacter marisflavi]|uniref:hypothetical protein n=1 Tax=Cohaesibacter marisflavi TaxID=655353 RepID=UPI0029C80D34|nr:hypothetical protein [Cohaesibacter marisflavi]